MAVGASWTEAEVEEILRRHAGRAGALLPILNDVQAAFGFVPDGGCRSSPTR